MNVPRRPSLRGRARIGYEVGGACERGMKKGGVPGRTGLGATKCGRGSGAKLQTLAASAAGGIATDEGA